VVICLERGADLHTAQLMPLPLNVTCFNKIQTGFAFLVPAYLASPGKRAIKRMCVLDHLAIMLFDLVVFGSVFQYHVKRKARRKRC